MDKIHANGKMRHKQTEKVHEKRKKKKKSNVYNNLLGKSSEH